MQKKNVFVVGMDDFNREKLHSLELAKTVNFHQLLTQKETKERGTYPLPKLMEKAEGILNQFDGSIDAIVGFWDFPVTSMVPLLCRKYGLRSASVESVLKCEHKYWSRQQQSQVIEDIPRFFAVDPWDEKAFEKIDLEFPFWVKPVKSFSSHLAFKIDSRDEFERAMGITCKKIGFIAKPFNWFIEQSEYHEAFEKVDGFHCIAEEPISGDQCTVEGYVIDGEVQMHGLIDSISYNIEFFYDADQDRIRLLEINQRISQSHAEIFERVDGVSNHQVMVDVALGNRPNFPKGQGKYPMAAKCFLRRFENGRVSHAPHRQDLERLQQEVPGVVVEVHATEGMELADLIEQDAYSYVLAEIYLGGSSEEAILRDYARVVDALDFEFEGSRQHHFMDILSAEQLNQETRSQGMPPSGG